MTMSLALTAAENTVLAALPGDARGRLQPLLQAVYCQRGDVLLRADEPQRFAFFPVSAVVSLVVRLASGQVLEVGLVGRDGCAGAPVVDGVTPCVDAVVQIPGAAWRIDLTLLRRELARSPALAAQLDAGLQRLCAEAMRIAACNMFHPAQQRCIRWLLKIADLVGRHEVPVTHELMATMLGVRRSTVTLVLRALHARGLVVEHRGRISLVDLPGLEAACCECRRQDVRHETRGVARHRRRS